MDVGCGTGSTLAFLQRAFPSASLTGIDNLPTAIEMCRQSAGTIRLHLHDITIAPPPSHERQNAVTLLDVLEHIEDPRAALRHVRSILAPGGIVIASVPISPSLFCARDTYVGHFKRYQLKELRSLFSENGYRVLACSAFFSFLFLPAFLLRRILFPLLNTAGHEIDRLEFITIPGLNGLLTLLGMTEACVAVRLPLPLGTSAFCVATPQS